MLNLGVETFGAQSVHITGKDVLMQTATGTLLCELSVLLLDKQVPGADPKPRSRAAMISNVNRALQQFREVKNLSPRYLWSVEEIVSHDPDVIWGLLEDLKNVEFALDSVSQILSPSSHTYSLSFPLPVLPTCTKLEEPRCLS